MSTIIAYPGTPSMVTREAINAMLSHVAFGQSMGYRADALHASNYRRILEDWEHFVEPRYVDQNDVLVLVPKVPHNDSAGNLSEFVKMLTELCNRYPIYDDEDYSALETERALEYLEQCRKESDPEAGAILEALYDLDRYPLHEPDGSVYISESDYAEALAYLTDKNER